jgi:hypothetical protein
VAGFFLARTTAVQPIGFIAPPTMRPLAPRATLAGGFELPLPLAPWHNAAWAGRFETPPTAAELRVQVLLEEPAWLELADEAGGVLRVPANRTLRIVLGEQQPLPIPDVGSG